MMEPGEIMEGLDFQSQYCDPIISKKQFSRILHSWRYFATMATSTTYWGREEAADWEDPAIENIWGLESKRAEDLQEGERS